MEREFARHLQSRVELIPEMGKYVQMGGGKRVRPAVLLMSSRLCGYKGDRGVLNAAVVDSPLPVPDAERLLRGLIDDRSDERRVGKECSELCRSRWSPYH